MERVELHLHTKMSEMDGIDNITDYIEKSIVKFGWNAIAITDHCSAQAFPEVQKYLNSQKFKSLGKKIKVIYGLEICFSPYNKNNYKEMPNYHMVILVKNKVGLKNLYKIISSSYIDTFYKEPILLKEFLDKHRDGLIIGTACYKGELYSALLEGKTDEELEKIAKYYDYLEVQPLQNNKQLLKDGQVKNIEELKLYNEKIIELGEKTNKLVVATGDVHFLEEQEQICRDILKNAQGYDKTEVQLPLYLKSTEEMLKDFDYLGEEKAREIVVNNSNKIADMCEKINPISSEKCYPHIPNSEKQIVDMTYKKANELYGKSLPKEVQDRIDNELKYILDNNFSDLYIIAHKLVKKSKDDGYIVSPRRSIASSFVANMIGITEINPLPPHYRCPKCKYSNFGDYGIKIGVDLLNKKCPKCKSDLEKDGMNIPFEIFTEMNENKELDIELNFSNEYKEKIFEFTKEIFGNDKIFEIGRTGVITEQMAYTYMQKYYKEKDLSLDDNYKKLIGIKKNINKNPASIVIIPKEKEIYDFTPIQCISNDKNSIVTHFDYNLIDGNLLKLNLLQNEKFTILKRLQELTGVDPTRIPLDDKKTINLFNETDKINKEIMGFNTELKNGILKEIKPSTFNELVRVFGLAEGVNTWVDNAQNLIKENIANINEVITCRDDIFLYLLSKGLEKEIAFNITKIVGKAKSIEINKIKSDNILFNQWKEYSRVMREHDIPDWYINSCGKIMYLDTKANLISNVLNDFRMAWFKVHYPDEFYKGYRSVIKD